jgi:hypothetical protein
MTPPPRSASTSPLSARRTASRSAESANLSLRAKRSNQPFLKMRVMAGPSFQNDLYNTWHYISMWSDSARPFRK